MAMASLCYLILAGFLLPAAQSLTCSSQKFANRSFAHCEDLPHLDAFIHWTYDSKNSSLSVAFLAPPPRPGGWVAWAVNPTATGMAGAQALLAGGTAAPSVRTFNISSYSSVVPSPALSFAVWDVAAESTGGRVTIYAKLKVPAKAKSLNQVWQVGPAVDPNTGGPAVHEFKPANLNAKGVLEFVKSKRPDASPAPRAHGGASPAPSPTAGGHNDTATAAAAPRPDKGAAAGIRSRSLGFVFGLFLFIWGIIIF